MTWDHPPIAKIYEALGAVADGRIEIADNAAKVYSSTRNKYYEVTYDPKANEIMSNDNASYWKGYLGYPAIAFLMKIGVLPYSEELGSLLKGIPWKDINQKFKNDFDKALEYVLEPLPIEQRKHLEEFVEKVDKEIKALGISMLGAKKKPPEGY